AREEHGGVQVDAEHLAVALEVQIDRERRAADARVVDEHVERPYGRLRLGHEVFERRCVREIPAQRMDGLPEVRDLFAIDRDDARSLLDEPLDDGPADAVGGPSHERDPPVEQPHPVIRLQARLDAVRPLRSITPTPALALRGWCMLSRYRP